MLATLFGSVHHLPPGVPSFVHTFAPYVATWGYWWVVFFLGLESLGIPLPGETTLIAAAIFAGVGELNIFWLIAIAIVTAVVGDNIGFAIGNFGGERLLLRYGKYIGVTKKRLDRVNAFFNRRGPIVVVIARFIEGLRQLNGIIAGMSTMRWPRFLIFNITGAVIWVIMWSTVGYYGGSHINTLLKYQTYVSIAFGVLVVALLARHFVKRRKERREDGEEGAEVDAAPAPTVET